MTFYDKLRRWVRFNLRYFGSPPWDTGISPPELQSFLQESDSGRALDLGCGTGTNLLTMAQQGWKVVGVDFAWLSVRQARSKFRQTGLKGRVIQGSVTAELGLDGVYDLVLDIGCYHNLAANERAVYQQKLARWLRDGGTYLLYAHRRRSPEAAHGIDAQDMAAFGEVLEPIWEKTTAEDRPDGGGGYPATWARFDR